MKKLLAVFAIGLMIVMTMPQADAAKRFGGGSSFGRQAPVPALSQKAPAANPAQNFNRQQANPAAGAAAAAKPASPWKGMLMLRSVLPLWPAPSGSVKAWCRF